MIGFGELVMIVVVLGIVWLVQKMMGGELMKAIALFMLFLTVCGCSEQVTVMAIEETDNCLGGYNVVTTFDSQNGRFKRCGWWGRVGETFQFSRWNVS